MSAPRAAVLALFVAALAQPAAAALPRLIVLISGDQMCADYIDDYGERWEGGLRRLVERGAWYRAAAYPYSHTVTCAGHATIATGTFPASHGMVLNSWWDRGLARFINCTFDPSVQNLPVGAPPAAGPGDGPANLLMPTLGDSLRLQRDARVAAFSLKARSAITLAGRRVDAILWIDDASGRWTSSTAYGPAPAFLARVASEVAPTTAAGAVWERALPEADYRHADADDAERPTAGWGVSFPHVLASADSPELVEQWRASPFSDQALERLAEAALRELELGRSEERTDLLAISFSALDIVGHDFGPRSHEVQDILHHLDATLGRLLDAVDASVDRDHYVVALSADHGVAPIPEQAAALGLDAGRASAAAVGQAVDQAMAGALGAGPWVAAATYTDVYLEPGAWERLRAAPEALAAVRAAVLAVPSVERVYTRDELAAVSDLDLAGRRVATSYRPERSGDIVVVWKPYWIATRDATTHGTPRDYDRRVPVLLMGAGIRPGVYYESASPADIAPTLALLGGVSLASSEGRVLGEALEPSR